MIPATPLSRHPERSGWQRALRACISEPAVLVDNEVEQNAGRRSFAAALDAIRADVSITEVLLGGRGNAATCVTLGHWTPVL